MDLNLNEKLADGYRSASQRSRVITERWVGENIFCPSCGERIESYENNKPVADFYCAKCREDFELKAKKGRIGKRVSAGAYSKMMDRINSLRKPNFFFMEYLVNMSVSDFFVVPKHFIIPEIIEKRKALAESAKRSGWVGSNILFCEIPYSGKIFYVRKGDVISKRKVLEEWKKTYFLKEIEKDELKGWILDVMNCIKSLNKSEFTLGEMYAFEDDLKMVYPKNNNIKDKIRQQLQFLRNKGYLEFTERGRYRLI